MKYFITLALAAAFFTKASAEQTIITHPTKDIVATSEINTQQMLDKLQVESENTVFHSLINMSTQARTKAQSLKKPKQERIRFIKKVDPNRH